MPPSPFRHLLFPHSFATALSVTIALCLAGCGAGGPQETTEPVQIVDAIQNDRNDPIIRIGQYDYVAHEVLVRMRDAGSLAATEENVAAVVRRHGLGATVYRSLLPRLYLMIVPDDRDIAGMADTLNRNPMVEIAELNGVGTTGGEAP
jgi:hypothetical protein